MASVHPRSSAYLDAQDALDHNFGAQALLPVFPDEHKLVPRAPYTYPPPTFGSCNFSALVTRGDILVVVSVPREPCRPMCVNARSV